MTRTHKSIYDSRTPDRSPRDGANALPIVLASASPRRRELLQQLGLSFEIAPANVNEEAIPHRTPRELALKAALLKVGAVESQFSRAILIGADTVVARQNIIYGKPRNPDDAVRMLRELSGERHSVITGVVVKEIGKLAILDAVETFVEFRMLAEEEILHYVATGEPLDKAGAYAIQGGAAQFVRRVEGDFWNVVGLPVQRLLELLSMFIDVAPYRSKLRLLHRVIATDHAGELSPGEH